VCWCVCVGECVLVCAFVCVCVCVCVSCVDESCHTTEHKAGLVVSVSRVTYESRHVCE